MNNNYEVDILVNSKPIKKYAHQGRVFVEARKGQTYSIRIKNNTWKRLLFVVACDGLNVVDGHAGGLSKAGYVIQGYSSYEVAGFRTSNEEVHPFKFNDKPKSYAAKSEETSGDTSSCGVIGVQVYEEQVKPSPVIQYITKKYIEIPQATPITWTSSPTANPLWYENSNIASLPLLSGCNITGGFNPNNLTFLASSADLSKGMTFNCNVSNLQNSVGNSAGENMLRCCSFMSQSEPTFSAAAPAEEVFQAGTEFSKEAKVDKVTDTEFEMGRLLVTFEIFYDYRDGLLNMGVPVTKDVKVALPSAFPARFCKPPKD